MAQASVGITFPKGSGSPEQLVRHRLDRLVLAPLVTSSGCWQPLQPTITPSSVQRLVLLFNHCRPSLFQPHTTPLQVLQEAGANQRHLRRFNTFKQRRDLHLQLICNSSSTAQLHLISDRFGALASAGAAIGVRDAPSLSSQDSPNNQPRDHSGRPASTYGSFEASFKQRRHPSHHSSSTHLQDSPTTNREITPEGRRPPTTPSKHASSNVVSPTPSKHPSSNVVPPSLQSPLLSLNPAQTARRLGHDRCR